MFPDIDSDDGSEVEKRILNIVDDQSVSDKRGRKEETDLVRSSRDLESASLGVEPKPAPSRSLNTERSSIKI